MKQRAFEAAHAQEWNALEAFLAGDPPVFAADAVFLAADAVFFAADAVFFARGICPKGAECAYLHRLPGIHDMYSPNVDVFGRDKHSDYRDDMALLILRVPPR